MAHLDSFSFVGETESGDPKIRTFSEGSRQFRSPPALALAKKASDFGDTGEHVHRSMYLPTHLFTALLLCLLCCFSALGAEANLRFQ